jgi:UrcA family protein
MTKNLSITRPLFALAAWLVAAPLAAQEPTVVTGERQPAYQERISYADLDLRGWSAQQTLKGRVYRAADRVCSQANGPFSINEIGLGSSLNCADSTYKATRPQIKAAINQAKAGQNLAAAVVVLRFARD